MVQATGYATQVQRALEGRRNKGAPFPTPFQGLELTFATHRWFAPPANFHGASGANQQMPSNAKHNLTLGKPCHKDIESLQDERSISLKR